LANGDTLNGFTTDDDGANEYIFDAIFDDTGISRIFAHGSDTLNAGAATGPLNFNFGSVSDFKTSTIVGTAATNDTLTLNISTAGPETIADTDFGPAVASVTGRKTFIESLVLNSVHATQHANFQVVLGTNAQNTGIRTAVGGNGSDLLNASAMTVDVSLFGGVNVLFAGETANTVRDTLLGGTGDDYLYGDNFNDSLVGNNGADTLTGTSSTALGANEIDTLTGGSTGVPDADNDLFVLGDASNAYYNTASGKGDYAIITDFTAGDKIRLKNVSSLYTPTTPIAASATYNFGYVEGTSNVFNVTVAGVAVDRFIYADADKDGVISSGDNLIAAIDSGVGALDLQNYARFDFV
jgi:hypothetical protein